RFGAKSISYLEYCAESISYLEYLGLQPTSCNLSIPFKCRFGARSISYLEYCAESISYLEYLGLQPTSCNLSIPFKCRFGARSISYLEYCAEFRAAALGRIRNRPWLSIGVAALLFDRPGHCRCGVVQAEVLADGFIDLCTSYLFDFHRVAIDESRPDSHHFKAAHCFGERFWCAQRNEELAAEATRFFFHFVPADTLLVILGDNVMHQGQGSIDVGRVHRKLDCPGSATKGSVCV